MGEEKVIFVFIIVSFLIYLMYEIYSAVKANKDGEEIEETLSFLDKIDSTVENSGYKCGEWEKEIRSNLKPIIKVKKKYETNKPINILVGDYNKGSVSNTIYILESMGIKTSIAKSGIEIIKRIKDGEQYDLIITNNIYDRGHCDGPETLDHLKEIENFKTPVIVLTVSENERDKFVNYYGFDEYITKLLTQEKVLETLPKVIKGLSFNKKSNKS